MLSSAWSTGGVWAGAFATALAVFVALRQPAAVLKKQAEQVAVHDAAQVTATWMYHDSSSHSDRGDIAAEVRVKNFSTGIIRNVLIIATWTHGQAYLIDGVSSEMASLNVEGPVIAASLPFVAPTSENGVLAITVDKDGGEPLPELSNVEVTWTDRQGNRQGPITAVQVFQPYEW